MTPAGATRLTVTAFGEHLMCAVARETLSYKAVVPFEKERVGRLSRQLVEVLHRGNRERKLTDACLRDLGSLGEELYRLLVPPDVREELHALSSTPLLVEMDEHLVAVPWELLFDGKEFLCRRFPMGRTVVTPQARRAPGAKRMSTPARMLILASDPRRDLPHVAAEGDAILEELGRSPLVSVRLLAERSVEEVRRILKDYDIVHFAGHADFDAADPEASGWHLRDGKLTARDVAELAGGRPMPLLVFSNACQSSHSTAWTDQDPRRVFGLANAFLLSGVRYYVGTQWEIVDVHSHHFARAFYAELGRGRSIGAAVLRAREAVLVAEGEGALGWAGYVLYGNPAYVPLGAEADVSGPFKLPTPADIAARESIRAVQKSGPHSPLRSPQPVAPPRAKPGRPPLALALWILAAAAVAAAVVYLLIG